MQQSFTPTSILVTGGAGFIGSNFINHVIPGNPGCRVVNLDLLTYGSPAPLPFDPERIMILDEGTYEAHAGILLAQALHHGNAHREQICAILTSFGLEPPDLQPCFPPLNRA